MGRLDIKTKLFFRLNNANIVEHEKIKEYDSSNYLTIKDENNTDVYQFKNYEEYKKYFGMYLMNVDPKVINLAILRKDKNGQIFAIKKICDYIIVSQKTREINELHNSDEKVLRK